MRNCPLCGSAAYKLYDVHARAGIKLQWNQCEKCLHCFTENFIPHDKMKELQRPLPKEINVAAHHELRLAWHRSLSNFGNIEGKRLLDIGYRDGFAVMAALERGADACGVDMMDVPDYLKGSPRFLQGMAEDIKHPADLIILADIVEHIENPIKFLRNIRNMLNDGGMVMISMPFRDETNQIYITPEQNPYWGEIEHCHYFEKQRLDNIMKQLGFERFACEPSERYLLCLELFYRKCEFHEPARP